MGKCLLQRSLDFGNSNRTKIIPLAAIAWYLIGPSVGESAYSLVRFLTEVSEQEKQCFEK